MSVNTTAHNLTTQVRGFAQISQAAMDGDFARLVTEFGGEQSQGMTNSQDREKRQAISAEEVRAKISKAGKGTGKMQGKVDLSVLTGLAWGAHFRGQLIIKEKRTTGSVSMRGGC